MSKLEIASAKNEKYYRQFDFFFARSAFRIMAEFYKEKFNSFYADSMDLTDKQQLQMWKLKQKQGGLTVTPKDEMDQLLKRFLTQTFGECLLGPEVTEQESRQIVNSLMMVIFSHRVTKCDRFIREAEQEPNSLVDFSIIRDVMYKYSKKSQDRFFSHPIESFLFAAFAMSDEGNQFVAGKTAKDPNKLERLSGEISMLKSQAVENLATSRIVS